MVRVRQMLRDRMHQSGMRERIRLLGAVATHEDRDKLDLWADEYELPEEMRTSFWDEMLLSRYKKEKNVEKIDAQYQKILYAHVNNTVYYLTDGLSYDMKLKKMGKDFADPERYRLALDTLSLYSGRVDDIFIFTRIIAQVRYAEALLINGYGEESLAAFALAAEYLSVLHQLPQGCLLSGSVPVLDSVRFTVDVRDKLEKCVFFIGNYDTDPLFDTIRKDKRFVAYTASLEQFFPQRESRSWVNEQGSDEIDASWEMLLRRASKEADQLSDGNAVVILTEKGTVDSISFQNTDAAIDAEGAMRFLVEKKKSDDTRIERLVCMWHDGSIGLPSFAFREALVAVDSKNLSAQMLLPGLTGFVIKTVKATMPKGYRA